MDKIIYFPKYELIHETKTFYYIKSYGTNRNYHISTVHFLKKRYGNAVILSKDSYVPKKVKEWIQSLTKEEDEKYALIQIRK